MDPILLRNSGNDTSQAPKTWLMRGRFFFKKKDPSGRCLRLFEYLKWSFSISNGLFPGLLLQMGLPEIFSTSPDSLFEESH